MSLQKKALTNSSSEDQINDYSSEIHEKQQKNDQEKQFDQSKNIYYDDTQQKQIISSNLHQEIKISAKVQTIYKQLSQELEKFCENLQTKENKRISLKDKFQKPNFGNGMSHQTKKISNPQILVGNVHIHNQFDIPQNFMMNQTDFNGENRDFFQDQLIHNQFSSSEEPQYQRSISDSNVQTEQNTQMLYFQSPNHDQEQKQQK